VNRKKCSKCAVQKDNLEYSLTEFVKNCSVCKKCVSEYNADWRRKNPDKKKQTDKNYRENNKEEINSQRRIENLTLEEILEIRAASKTYRDKNNVELNARRRKRKKERFATDPSYKIREVFGTHFRGSLKLKNIEKKSSCFDILDYTFDELKFHLESQFESWMSWENHGKYSAKNWNDNDSATWTWQIDHIIPKANFIFSNDDTIEIKKCWALSNLRPYSAKQNNIDGGTKIRHNKKENK
jgi:hypothetical protein